MCSRKAQNKKDGALVQAPKLKRCAAPGAAPYFCLKSGASPGRAVDRARGIASRSMLSVRSLAKIAARKQMAIIPVDVGLKPTKGISLPPPNGYNGKPSVVTFSDEPAAAAPEEPRLRCPHPKDLYNRLCNFLVELQAMGAGDLLIFTLLVMAAWWMLTRMSLYLSAVLHMQLPSVTSATGALFGFAAAYPVTYLVLNFGIGILIGLAFLFLETIQASLRELQERSRKLLKQRGYSRLVEADEASADAEGGTGCRVQGAGGDDVESGPATSEVQGAGYKEGGDGHTPEGYRAGEKANGSKERWTLNREELLHQLRHATDQVRTGQGQGQCACVLVCMYACVHVCLCASR